MSVLTHAFPQHVQVTVEDALVAEVDPAEVVLLVDVDPGVVEDEVGLEGIHGAG